LIIYPTLLDHYPTPKSSYFKGFSGLFICICNESINFWQPAIFKVIIEVAEKGLEV
jgi:hypothetical protein